MTGTVLWAAMFVVAGLLGWWLVKLRRVSRSVRRYADYWRQPRGEQGGLLYVAQGDSAAQGIGATRPERGYVGLLAERLREATGGPVQLVNLSVSGARVRDVVEVQLPQLADLRPDVVTVGVGGNDLRRYDEATYRADLEALAVGLPAGTVVADVPYFMHGRFQRDASSAAALLCERASGAGMRVAPVHAAMQRRGAAAMVRDFAADLFHPNDRGHRVWADAFWSEVRQLPVVARIDPVPQPPGPGPAPPALPGR